MNRGKVNAIETEMYPMNAIALAKKTAFDGLSFCYINVTFFTIFHLIKLDSHCIIEDVRIAKKKS